MANTDIKKLIRREFADTSAAEAGLETQQAGYVQASPYYRSYKTAAGATRHYPSTTGDYTQSGQVTMLSTAKQQLKLAYDGSNYVLIGANSAGDLVITPTGGDVTIPMNVKLSLNSNAHGYIRYYSSLGRFEMSGLLLYLQSTSGTLKLECPATGNPGITLAGNDPAGTAYAHGGADRYLIIDSAGRLKVGAAV